MAGYAFSSISMCCLLVRQYWILGQGRCTLVKAIFAKDAKCSGQSALEVFAFGLLVAELGGFGDGHFDLGL